MSELLAEMDEAIKRERLEYIWKKYGNLIIVLILLIILGTGGYSGYTNWKQSNDQKKTSLLIAADNQNDPEKLVAVAKDLDSGLASIAKIKAAGRYYDQKEEAKALGLYAEVAADKTYPKEFRDLGAFMKARIEAKTSPEASLSAFESMAADAENDYRLHSHLEAALIFAHVKSDYTSAIKHLDLMLQTKDIPQNLSAKANALRVIYALKEKK